MKISSILCLKCQNDKADHTIEYCPTHTCKNCGVSGHVTKVCPKKGTTKKTNGLTLSQFKELLVIKYDKRAKLSLSSDENLEINETHESPSTLDCSDDVFEVHSLISKSF